jgi:hypothetical protein
MKDKTFDKIQQAFLFYHTEQPSPQRKSSDQYLEALAPRMHQG